MSASGFRYEEEYRPHPNDPERMMSYRSLDVIQTGDDKIEFWAEDGDKGGMGAERNSSGVEIPFEDARRLVEYLHPILYGKDDEKR